MSDRFAVNRRAVFPFITSLLAAPTAFAWPDAPLRVVVPFTPAGGPDIIARYIAERLSTRLGQPVLVENIPGASGNIGSQVVARAKPDGTTLMSSVNTLVMNVSLYRNLPYNPVADFVPISLTAWGTLVLVAHPSQEPDTLDALIALAKAKPRGLNYGSPGVGTPHHLAMALLETTAGIEMLHVPYKGAAGALQDILGGQIGYMFLPVHVAATYINSARLKPLAVGSPQRAALLPQVPTLSEAGLKDVDVDMWYAFFAPKGTPAEVVDRLNKDIVAILDAPQAKAAFEVQGLVPATSTSAELNKIVVRDLKRWADVIARRGIQQE